MRWTQVAQNRGQYCWQELKCTKDKAMHKNHQVENQCNMEHSTIKEDPQQIYYRYGDC